MGREIQGVHIRDGCVLDEQRNKQPFPMNTVGPDGTISDTFLQLLAQIALSYEQIF